jgi:GGDEF domain-containing protein
MSRFTRFERFLAATAMTASGIAAWIAVTGDLPAAAACAVVAGLAVGADFLIRRRTRPSPQRLHADKFINARRDALYEPNTGLFAHWYIELRGQEECDRAGRYSRTLALLVIEPTRPHDDARHLMGLRQWLGSNLRSSDVAGVLGNGRYIIIMPEASGDSAGAFIGRMKADGFASTVGIACFPDDGATFAPLYRAAVSQLPVTLRQIA